MTDHAKIENRGAPQPEQLSLQANGWVPNNARLPALIYRGAFVAADPQRTAETIERVFRSNGWTPQ